MKRGPGIAQTPLPKGFYASGVNSGVRAYRPDVGLIVSDSDMTAAGVFTQSEAKAAPVLWSQKLVPSKKIRAIITNSGQANAATAFDFGFALGPRINAAGRLSDMTLGIECLLTDDAGCADELAKQFDATEYAAWRAFRDSSDSRYLSLTMPRFLGRHRG